MDHFVRMSNEIFGSLTSRDLINIFIGDTPCRTRVRIKAILMQLYFDINVLPHRRLSLTTLMFQFLYVALALQWLMQ